MVGASQQLTITSAVAVGPHGRSGELVLAQPRLEATHLLGGPAVASIEAVTERVAVAERLGTQHAVDPQPTAEWTEVQIGRAHV